jgi:hypothetical protein
MSGYKTGGYVTNSSVWSAREREVFQFEVGVRRAIEEWKDKKYAIRESIIEAVFRVSPPDTL